MRSISWLLFCWCCVSVAAAKPLVISTNTIVADFVRTIAGDAIETSCLLPPGVDPHSYEPKPTDIRLVARADLIVANGLGFENWINKLVENSGFHGPVQIAATGVPPLYTAGGEIDPHAWHDLANARRYVENIRDALARLLPAEADEFSRRARAYLAELDALQTYTLNQIGALPPERRKLVTSHDAFGYFAHAYGLTIVSINGLRPDQEPSAKQLARVVDFIRDQKVPAVLFESTSNPKLLEEIGREAGVKIVRELYTDSLGPTGSSSTTFLGCFRANVDTIVGALH